MRKSYSANSKNDAPNQSGNGQRVGKKKTGVSKLLLIVAPIIVIGIVIGIVTMLNQHSYLAMVENREGKYGYINQKGEEVIPCQYDTVYSFQNNGLAMVGIKVANQEEKYKWSIINVEGKNITGKEYDYVDERGFSECGLLVVAENGQYGAINESGEEEISCKYDGLSVFNKNGLARVASEGKYGVIDRKEKVVVPLEYDGIAELISENGMVPVTRDVEINGEMVRRATFFNIETQKEGSFNYYQTRTYSENGLALVSKALFSEFGFVNEDGEEVIPCIYDGAGEFYDGKLACVYNVNLGVCGFVNKKGEMIVPMKYTIGHSEGVFHGKYCIVDASLPDDEKRLYGLLNDEGTEVVPCKYEEMKGLNNLGLCAVGQDKSDEYTLWGIINTEGEIILPMEYEYVRTGVVRKSDLGYRLYCDLGWMVAGMKNGSIDLNADGNTSTYKCKYVNEKGKTMLELPEKYILAGAFVKVA